jgi:hypothetical protein
MTPPSAARATGALAALPWLLLIAYAVAFAAASLGSHAPLFDDHPGQIARVWHVVNHGFAPWAWNPSWWMGYPELQFYPPAFSYTAAFLHWLSFGALTVPGAYLVMVWVAYFAPGITTLFALGRIQGSAWRALPGAFIVLALSLWPLLESGVEGAIHVGMAPARLAWAMLPLLLGLLAPWAEGVARFPARSVVLVAALIALLHPVQLPAGVVLVGLAALVRPPRAQRLLQAFTWLAVAAMLTAFWTVPLVARVAQTRALAWRTVEDAIGNPGLVVALAVLCLRALWLARSTHSGGAWVAAAFPWAMGVAVWLDASVLEAHGIRLLPADRVMDSAWLALVLGASFGAVGIARPGRASASRLGRLEALAAGAAGLVVASMLLPRLSMWPDARLWAGRAQAVDALPMDALWRTLEGAPAGRVLFLRSGVPLAPGNWLRAHTHITALTPARTGREIVNGTFTHPSPIAAWVYRGDAGRGAITSLAEQVDGESLFGVALESLDAASLDAYARRMRVSTIVALDEDVPRLRALADNPHFATRRSVPPFVIWEGAPVALPAPAGDGRWRVTLDGAGEWASAGITFYPLWSATANDRKVETRRGADGVLEVRAPGDSMVELTYAPGWPELAGLGISVLGAIAWLLLCWPAAVPWPRKAAQWLDGFAFGERTEP